MLRRLLWACLAAALVGTASPGLAKPPDLPEDHRDTVKPQITEEGPNTVVPCPPPPISAPPNRVVRAAYWPAPTDEPPSLFELLHVRPTVLRRLSSCLLYTVHPLLGLLPTDDFLEDPGEYFLPFTQDTDAYLVSFVDAGTINDPPPAATVHGSVAIGVGLNFGGFGPPVSVSVQVQVQEATTGSLLFGVGCNSDAGLTGSVVLNEKNFDVTPQTTPEKPAESAPMTCPWRRMPTGRRCIVSDPEVTCDVIGNLEKLIEADRLLEQARELGRQGHLCEALACLEKAAALCPGSRIEERVAEVRAELFPRVYCLPVSEEPCEEPKASTEDRPRWWQRLLNLFLIDTYSDNPNRHMQQLLNQSEDLREIENEVERFWMIDCPCHITYDRLKSGLEGEKKTSKEREIEYKLTLPVCLNFADVPLRQALDDIRAWQGINIVPDMRALEEGDIRLDRPISLKVEQVSLKSALGLLLKQVHLTYVIKDEVLQITTEQGARGKPMTRTYQVDDLLTWGRKGAVDDNEQAETLINLITCTVQPMSWADRGGPCTIDYFPLSMSLVINATPDVQEQVEDLLASLRRLHVAAAADRLRRSAVAAQVSGLMKACRLAMDEGRHARAAELAREAFALDPERVQADPLVYKMHLLSVMRDQGLCCAGDKECNEGECTCPAEAKVAKAAVHARKMKRVMRQVVVPPLKAKMPPVDPKVVETFEKIGIDFESGNGVQYILTDEATGEEMQEPRDACRAVAKSYRALLQSSAEEPFRAGHAKDGAPAQEAEAGKDGGPGKCTYRDLVDPCYPHRYESTEWGEVCPCLSDLLPGVMQLEVDASGDQVRLLWQCPLGRHLCTVR
jgi:hypothetical protein